MNCEQGYAEVRLHEQTCPVRLPAAVPPALQPIDRSAFIVFLSFAVPLFVLMQSRVAAAAAAAAAEAEATCNCSPSDLNANAIATPSLVLPDPILNLRHVLAVLPNVCC